MADWFSGHQKNHEPVVKPVEKRHEPIVKLGKKVITPYAIHPTRILRNIRHSLKSKKIKIWNREWEEKRYLHCFLLDRKIIEIHLDDFFAFYFKRSISSLRKKKNYKKLLLLIVFIIIKDSPFVTACTRIFTITTTELRTRHLSFTARTSRCRTTRRIRWAITSN